MYGLWSSTALARLLLLYFCFPAIGHCEWNAFFKHDAQLTRAEGSLDRHSTVNSSFFFDVMDDTMTSP